MEMISIGLTILIISIASNIFTNDIDPLNWFKLKIGLGPIRKLKSGYRFLDLIFYTIWKLLNCSSCISYWATAIYFLIICGSFNGFYLGVISYALSSWLYNNVFITKNNF